MSEAKRFLDAADDGFTLLELLVVLAVIGAMVGALLFFALPSSLQQDKAQAQQAFELMQKMRLQSILQRKILGLDKPEEENLLRVVVLDRGAVVSTPVAAPPTNGELFEAAEDPDPDAAENPEANRRPDYAKRKERASQLGLVSESSEATWQVAEDYDAIDFGDEGILFLFFAQQEDVVLGYGDLASTTTDEEEEEEETTIEPELVFFPDGRLSVPGSVRLVTAEDEILYAFSWDVFGRFELERQ